MNYLKQTVMASLMALTAAPGLQVSAADDAPIIEKPVVKVENGQFTPELLNALGRLSDPQLSPDGKRVLYGVSYPNVEQNKSNRELWVIDIDGKNARQLTRTKSSEQNAVWIDGGKRIAFIYPDADGEYQVWTMNADGSDRKQASTVKGGVDGFKLSNDQKKIVVISQVKYSETAQDVYPDLKKADARIIDDMMYRHWDEWVSTVPHPFVGDFDGNAVSNLRDVLQGEPFESPMKPWGGVESLAWTPDGKSLVYVCRKKTGKEYAISTNSDLYLWDVASGKTVKNLTEGNLGYDTYPVFSKSGHKLAWLSMERDGYEADKNRIMVMDMATGAKHDITVDWDYTADAIAWSDDEKYIYFIAPYQGTEPMFRINVATRKVETVADGQCDYAAIVPAGKAGILTMRHSMKQPDELYVVAKPGKEPQRITAVNDDIMDQLADITVEKRMVTTTDGKQMTTWVLLPPGFDANKKYPALLFCEGGPQSPVSQFWSYRWNLRLMAANGYIVIAPNRRGLPGFGTAWNEQISKDYGGQNMKDYMSAVDYMKQFPYVDSEHIGCTGASYGGYSTYWLAGHNLDKRFACFLAHAGIFNLEAQYLETEEMWFANWDMGGAFWELNNAAAQNTFKTADPHKFVQNWNSPIMVTVGEKDYRISFTQGMQAFNAAKLKGLPARFLSFPSENHWIVKPQNSVLWQREFFKWFDHWLKPGK